MKVHRHLLAAFAAIGLVGAGAALRSGSITTANATPSIPTDGTIADVAERVVDSVVNISVVREEKNDFAPDDNFTMWGETPHKIGAKGSGVIVTASGRILTNAHVVDGFDDITVTLQDGTELAAKVVGKDTRADIAVLQLKGNVPRNLKPLAFGDSSALRLGDIVLAVGDGMGVGKSVSMGIVSAKNRHFEDRNLQIEEYEDFIQTDAAINPGNSGGALVNLKGELVGINTAIASRGGGSQGIGFAIPSNMARPIMEMLAHDGKVTRGYLGVSIETVNAKVAKEDSLPTTSGVEIKGVQNGGPAATARLAVGDVIIGLDGRPMKDSPTLRNTIALMRPGTTVALDVIHHDGNRDTVKARLGELPEQAQVSQKSQQRVPNGIRIHPPMPQMPQGNGWNCTQTPNGWQCESHGGGGGFGSP